MKNLLMLFGCLDLITFYRSISRMPDLYDNGILSYANLAMLVLFLLILFSAIVHLKRHKLALYTTYVLFLPRLVVSVLTFGFLFSFFSTSQLIGVSVVVMVLEIVRLVITIVIHKKYYLNKV